MMIASLNNYIYVITQWCNRRGAMRTALLPKNLSGNSISTREYFEKFFIEEV